MTSSQEYGDQHRMSADVNNKTSSATVNNNPSSTSVADGVSSSPIVRASSGTATDQRSDFAEYRGGSGSGAGLATAVSVTPSFKSPKLESRGASGGGGTSAKKAQKTSHYHTATSMTGKWRQKTPDVSPTAAGGRSQASDSVRRYLSLAFFGHTGTEMLTETAVLLALCLPWNPGNLLSF